MTDPGAAAGPTVRCFLVVVDDTDEWRSALRFACRRAQHTSGRVALLRVIEPGELQQWAAIEEVMREERRQEAEQLLQRVAKEVNQITGTVPVLYVREGTPAEELMALIAEEPMVSVLVLGASPSADGPGPLIQYLARQGFGRMRVPVTIVPGSLTTEEIDALT